MDEAQVVRGLLLAGALTGCFAEVATTIVPREHQTVTAQDGTSSSTTGMAWSIGFWIGFHADLLGVALDYSPPWGGGRGTYVSDDKATDFGDDGHHLRADLDVKLQENTKLSATVGYDTMRHLNVDRDVPAATGRVITGGITIASLRRIFAFSLGGSYLAAKGESIANPHDGSYVPAIETTGTGVWFSFRIAAPRMQDLAAVADLDLRIERAPLAEGGGAPPPSSSSGSSCFGGYYAQDCSTSPCRTSYICP